MNGESNVTPGINLRAVGIGMIWGLGLMVTGAIVQGMVGHSSAVPESMIPVLRMVLQGLGALVGGYVSARRAQNTGWLHGALAGTALALSLAAVMGVGDALPTLAAVLRLFGIGTTAGILGGVMGVNTADR